MDRLIPQHEISVVVDRQRVPGWTDYRISSDILQPADAFSMRVRFRREAWDLLARDQLVTIYVDRVPLVTGYIDERQKVPGRDGTMIEINGRDKTGRLVDESCPVFKYGGLYLKDLAEKIVGLKDDADPLFERVTLRNTRNRSLLRNVRYSPLAKVIREPVVSDLAGVFRAVPRPLARVFPEIGLVQRAIERVERPLAVDPGIFKGRGAPRKVSAGESRWAVLEQFLSEARLIAWASGDGDELFVGMPNYEQANQYYFFEAAGETTARAASNCEITITESNAERYSMITCLGSSGGSEMDFGSNVTKHRATVYDNPKNRVDGTGATFRRRKALVVADDGVKGARGCLERAEREQLERDAGMLEVQVTAPGHGQRYRGDNPTLFAVDTMARVEDEDTGTCGDFLVVACEYSGGRGEPTQTRLRLVPRGTLLTL